MNSNSLIPVNIHQVPVASVLRVSCGLYDHVGLLSDRHVGEEPMVISLSPASGGVIEERFSQFARNRPVRADGYPETLPSWVVLSSARAMCGTPYSWTKFNCEHFIRAAHGLPVESPQLNQWAGAAIVVSLFALAAQK